MVTLINFNYNKINDCVIELFYLSVTHFFRMKAEYFMEFIDFLLYMI